MRRVVGALTLKRLRESRARGRVIRAFANTTGLIYFGAVDHQHDEHDVIRGLTVSTTHKDVHYAVGSFDGYDIALVDRSDYTVDRRQRKTWLIVQVTLKQSKSLPHLVLIPHVHQVHFERSLTGVRHIQPLDLLVPEAYPGDFLQRYTLYGPAHDAPAAQAVMSVQRAHEASVRLWPHAVELKDGRLYLYIEEHRLDKTVLGAAVESALWLADQIDSV